MVEIRARDAGPVAAAMQPDGDLVAERYARGCRCFAAWSKGALAGYGWLSTGPEWIGEIQLEIRPRSGEAYIWNCVTLPEHQRQGVFRSLLAGMTNIAYREGVHRLWIGTIAIPAEKVMPGAGFQPALQFRTLELGPLHLTRAVPRDRSLAGLAYAVLSMRSSAMIRRSRHRRH